MKAWQKLLAQMHEILDEDEENKNCGVRRMQIALEQRGIKRSLSTVRRVMARGNLLHEDRRSPDGLTKADKKAMRAQNIIKQDFSAQAPLRKLLTDITRRYCARTENCMCRRFWTVIMERSFLLQWIRI